MGRLGCRLCILFKGRLNYVLDIFINLGSGNNRVQAWNLFGSDQFIYDVLQGRLFPGSRLYCDYDLEKISPTLGDMFNISRVRDSLFRARGPRYSRKN